MSHPDPKEHSRPGATDGAEEEVETTPGAEAGAAEPSAQPSAPGVSGEPADAAGPDEEIARLEAEVATLKEQLLRALAETENVRRRLQRAHDEAVRYAAAPLVKDLAEVADNLRRAIEAVPPEAVAADDHLKTLIDGIEMTERALMSAFEKHGVSRIDPLGERLDPHLHEAMFEVPDPSKPTGTVVQVLRPGYRLHDRLIRPAQVGVAKGGPNAGSDTEPPAGGETPGGRVDTTA